MRRILAAGLVGAVLPAGAAAAPPDLVSDPPTKPQLGTYTAGGTSRLRLTARADLVARDLDRVDAVLRAVLAPLARSEGTPIA